MTRITNIQVEQQYAAERALLNGVDSDDYAVLNSDIIKTLPLAEEISRTSKVVHSNFWHNIARDGVVNTTSDDVTKKGVVNNLNQRQLAFAVYRPNSGTGVTDVVDEIKAGEALSVAAEYNKSVLMAKREASVFKALAGVTAADASRVRNISLNKGNSIFSFNELNKAKGILGHRRGTLRTLVVNAEGMTAIRQKLAEDKRDVNEGADGSITFGTLRVIESPYVPQMKVEAGDPLIADDTNDIAEGDVIATVYLLGAGVIGMGNGNPANPFEYERDAASANGGGSGTIWDRETYALTVAGFSWVDANGIATADDYADPTKWAYKLDDKLMCPLVAFKFRIPAADVVTL